MEPDSVGLVVVLLLLAAAGLAAAVHVFDRSQSRS